MFVQGHRSPLLHQPKLPERPKTMDFTSFGHYSVHPWQHGQRRSQWERTMSMISWFPIAQFIRRKSLLKALHSRVEQIDRLVLCEVIVCWRPLEISSASRAQPIACTSGETTCSLWGQQPVSILKYSFKGVRRDAVRRLTRSYRNSSYSLLIPYMSNSNSQMGGTVRLLLIVMIIICNGAFPSRWQLRKGNQD